MRLNFNTMQVSGNELITTFAGDQQGLRELADALNRACEVGVTRAIIHNDNASLHQHLVITCVDTPEAPVLTN